MTFTPSIPEDQASVKAILGPYPEMGRPLTVLTEHLMRQASCAFSPAERELIAAVTSQANACTYCFETHRATAAAFGIDPDLFAAVEADIATAPVADRLKPVLAYVRKLTATPSRMTQADADAIFAAGWSERDFHFAVSICALFNLYNRLLDGYGAKNTAEFRASRGALLAAHGYMPTVAPPEDGT